jgi:hypothetical protein
MQQQHQGPGSLARQGPIQQAQQPIAPHQGKFDPLAPLGWQSHRSQGVAQGLQIGPPPGGALAEAGHAQGAQQLIGTPQLLRYQLVYLPIYQLVYRLIYGLIYGLVYWLFYELVYWLFY